MQARTRGRELVQQQAEELVSAVLDVVVVGLTKREYEVLAAHTQRNSYTLPYVTCMMDSTGRRLYTRVKPHSRRHVPFIWVSLFNPSILHARAHNHHVNCCLRWQHGVPHCAAGRTRRHASHVANKCPTKCKLHGPQPSSNQPRHTRHKSNYLLASESIAADYKRRHTYSTHRLPSGRACSMSWSLRSTMRPSSR